MDMKRKLTMKFNTVLYEVDDRIATITLISPEIFNAINETMSDDFVPAGLWFKNRAVEVGFKQTIKELDSGNPLLGSNK